MAARVEPKVLRRAPAFLSSWRNLALTLVAALALIYGWNVTRIDLYQLVAGLPNMRHIVVGLLQPDFATPITETSSLGVPVQIGAGPGGASSSVDGKLKIEPASIEPGADFTVSGSGLQPSTPAKLLLVDSRDYARPIYSFTTG